MEIVHITFEKFTGPFKGSIHGTFLSDSKVSLDEVIVFEFIEGGVLRFRQGYNLVLLRFLESDSFEARMDYIRHFEYGMNFTIKEWSYGGRPVKIISQSPN